MGHMIYTRSRSKKEQEELGDCRHIDGINVDGAPKVRSKVKQIEIWPNSIMSALKMSTHHGQVSSSKTKTISSMRKARWMEFCAE